MRENAASSITIEKLGHTFMFSKKENGMIQCRIDGNDDLVDIVAIEDGTAKFSEKQKLKINGTVMGIGGLSLSEAELAALQQVGDQEYKNKVENPKVNASDDMPKAKFKETEKNVPDMVVANVGEQNMDEEYWRKLWAERKIALKQVDEWHKKQCSYKEKEKKGQKYCVHTFRIGNNKYRFIERQIPGTGVVINPDYRVMEDMAEIGGVPAHHGELIFWDYFYEDKGWQRIRVLAHNEEICLNIIQKYGFFAFPKEWEKKFRNQDSFLNKILKKKEKKDSKEEPLALPDEAGESAAE